MHLYTEAKAIAQEAWEESQFDQDDAQEFIHESCDGHEIVIYYHKAIQFCADVDTSDGEVLLRRLWWYCTRRRLVWTNSLPHCVCYSIVRKSELLRRNRGRT